MRFIFRWCHSLFNTFRLHLSYMKKCPNCHIELNNNARYCTACGTKVVDIPIPCTNCTTPNPSNAAFCLHCGTAMKSQEKETTTPPPPTETPHSAQQFLGHFMRTLRDRILEDHQSKQLDAYLDAFYHTGFNKYFISAAEQLVLEVKDLQTAAAGHQAQENLIHNRIENLLDYFIIHHCADINEVRLPETILKYHYTTLQDINFERCFHDFLNLEAENENVYTNFIEMPLEKLKTASQSFLFPEKDERIWLICDQGVIGSYKEGFAITESAIYWKAPFQSPKVAYFSDLKILARQKEWLIINDSFFNINRSLNLKMLYLLRRLRVLFSA